MALTLNETVKLAVNNGLEHKAAIVETFVRETDLLRATPWMNIMGSAYAWNEEAALAAAAFRNINASYTATQSVVTQRTQALKVGGGELVVDRALIKMHGADVRTKHEMMQAKGLAQKIGYTMVEGDADTDPAAFDGLKKLIPTTSSQALALASTAAMSCKALDELISMVDNPTHLLMSKAQERNMRAFLRSGGSGAAAIQIEKDEFGRPLLTYAGLPILIADRNGTTATLAYTEASSTASLFCLSIGLDGYHGIQNSEMDVVDLGEQQASPTYKTRVEWLCAHVLEGPRSAARGYSFTNATAVA